jgi:hypothetical protein
MSTPDTTTSDWHVALQPVLDALETERQRAQQKVMLAGPVIVIATIFTISILAASKILFSPFLMLLAIGLGAAIFAYIYSEAPSTYKSGFKSWVLPQLAAACAKEFGGALEYSPYQGIGEAEFNLSGLFSKPDRYKSEDLIVGKIGETQVRFAEVHAEYRTTSMDSKGRTREQYHTIFKGLFFVADFNKRFLSTTVVLPDTMQSLFGRFGQELQEFGTLFSSARRELVRLEDPHFEKTFAVYSSDQTEARYILSPALMQRLLLFRQRCNTDIRIVFSTGNMTIAIPMAVGWLEPPALSTPITLQSLELCIQQLHFACSIVSDLDLNTRIWSK